MIISCEDSANGDTAAIQVKAIWNTDSAFSDFSKEKGMKAAFLYYMDSSAVLLRPNRYPIIGKNAQQFFQHINDSAFTLTWVPQHASVAESGELGYTYGIYTYTNDDTTFHGTYVSIWKKQADGKWKFVLDTGNSGVGE